MKVKECKQRDRVRFYWMTRNGSFTPNLFHTNCTFRSLAQFSNNKYETEFSEGLTGFLDILSCLQKGQNSQRGLRSGSS